MTICPSWQTGIKVPVCAGGTNGQQTHTPKILIDWSTGGNRLKMERNIYWSQQATNPKRLEDGYDVQWRGGQFAKLIPENATCAIHKISPHQKLHFYSLLTSLIPEPFSHFSLRVTRTWTHTHIIPSPHTEKMLRKPSLDAVNLFFFGSFWGSIFCGMIIHIRYISYITIMKI